MHQYKTIAQTLLFLSVLNLVTAAPVVPREVRNTDNDVVVVAEDVATVSERRRGTPPVGSPVTTPSQHSPSSSLDGSPPHDSLPLDDPMSPLFQGSESSSEWAPSNRLSAANGKMPMYDSTWEASTSAHPLSGAVGPGPVHDSTWEASTSARPLSAPDGPGPVHDSTWEASTSAHPLPAPDGPAPDSNTEASTSSHRPVPVRGSTAGGATISQYTAITPDMLHKDPQKISTTSKVMGFSLLAGTIATVVLFSALYKGHNHNGTTGG